MTQRTVAGLLAVPLLIGLWVVAVTQPLPYVTYEPGLTVDVLDEEDGDEIIQVRGRRSYRDDGELRMTTVYVSQPGSEVNLFEVVAGWLSRDDAVYPYQAVYREDETRESNEEEGEIEMVSSQDTAIAVALTELGVDVEEAVEVFRVTKGAPADGVLEPSDLVVAVNGERVTSMTQVVEAVRSTPAGRSVQLEVVRRGKKRTVRVTPEQRDGQPFVGIQMLPGYEFPFDVEVEVDPTIGGPSAGLMFSLGIYDTLTPGALTGGAVVAGTGTVDADGKVGPIGGIQQKVAAAREAGAELFLVPPDNCDDAMGAANGEMRLVRAETMHDAVVAIEAWAEDPAAELPACDEAEAS